MPEISRSCIMLTVAKYLTVASQKTMFFTSTLGYHSYWQPIYDSGERILCHSCCYHGHTLCNKFHCKKLALSI